MKDRMCFWLKNIRWILIGMVLFFLVFLPWLSNLASQNQLWEYDAWNNYSTYLYGTLPFLCVIANLFIHREYVETGSGELLFNDRADVWMTIFNTILQVVLFLPLYFYFDDSTGDVTNLLTEIVLIVFFMNGVAMALTYVTKEPALTILFTLGYTVISNSKIFELMDEVVAPWTITTISTEGVGSSYGMNFVIAGVLAWIIGIIAAVRGGKI